MPTAFIIASALAYGATCFALLLRDSRRWAKQRKASLQWRLNASDSERRRWQSFLDQIGA